MKLVSCVGKLTRPPRVMAGSTDTTFATIAVEVDGERGARETEFVDLVFHGADATTIAAHGKVGTTIHVAGSERTKTFAKRDRTTGFANEIFVLRFDFVGSSK